MSRAAIVDQLRILSHVEFDGLANAALGLLKIRPFSNSHLSCVLGYGTPNGTHKDFVTWSLLHGRIEQHSSKSNILVPTDNDGTISINLDEAITNARLKTHKHLAALYTLFKAYIQITPETYNSRLARDLDCSFPADNARKDYVSHYILLSMYDQGILVRKKVSNRVMYSLVDDTIPYIAPLRTMKRASQSSGEAAMANELDKERPDVHIVYQSQSKFELCANPLTGKLLIFDFCVDAKMHGVLISFLIEVDGEQHYERTPYFHPTEQDFIAQQVRDAVKNDFCNTHRISLLRIRAKGANFGKELDNHLAQLYTRVITHGL